MERVATNIREALASFKGALVAAFGARLRRVVLFGSVARGEQHWDSDVDVLVVLDVVTPSDYRRVLDFAADEMVARDVDLSPVVMSQERHDQLIAHDRQLMRDIARDGMPL